MSSLPSSETNVGGRRRGSQRRFDYGQFQCWFHREKKWFNFGLVFVQRERERVAERTRVNQFRCLNGTVRQMQFYRTGTSPALHSPFNNLWFYTADSSRSARISFFGKRKKSAYIWCCLQQICKYLIFEIYLSIFINTIYLLYFVYNFNNIKTIIDYIFLFLFSSYNFKFI